MLLKKTTVAIACSLLLVIAVFVSLVIREETKHSDSTNLRSDDSSDLSSWFQTEGELIWNDEFNNKDLPYWSHAVQSDFSSGNGSMIDHAGWTSQCAVNILRYSGSESTKC